MTTASSAGSQGSRYSKRYRTKSKTSVVDETLFASPTKVNYLYLYEYVMTVTNRK